MEITVRHATPDDDGGPLLYVSSPGLHDLLFGNRARALTALRGLWHVPGGSASWDACLVAEIGDQVGGVLAGYPGSEAGPRATLFFSGAAGLCGVRRLPTLVRIIRAGAELTPPAPPGAWYVDALAVAPAGRRRGVAAALMDAATHEAQHSGADTVALDTQAGNVGARALYGSIGMTVSATAVAGRRAAALGLPAGTGFVGYAKTVRSAEATRST